MNNQNVEELIYHYGMIPEFIEQHGRVWRVATKNGAFALKQIKKEHAYPLFRNIHSLFQRGLKTVVPIYQTRQGHYFVETVTDAYYLMPWVEDQEEREVDFKDSLMFKELAKLHSMTVKEKEYQEEDITSFYNKLSEEWKKEQQELERFVDNCEKKLYMSPFELQVCTYAHEISLAQKFSLEKLESWQEAVTETKKHRVAMTHGRVSFHHFVKDTEGRGYFISWERAKQAPPANDIISFYQRYLRTYPLFCDDCVDWFYDYQKGFGLQDSEKSLTLSYLSHPGNFMQSIRRFQTQNDLRQKLSERELVKSVQGSYWLAKNIEYVAGRINQLEEQSKNKEAQTS
ncbi:spore coat protein YsxE [Bacillus sp. THAF10]|uniref:spore coat protein YsxE n=1 Tax=Bacillus sp. THAF10 TaxID=2587848 RepID=UPI001C12ABCB|nr:spore coat protein YsxE [Bacillus sp. THAF10]